MKRVILFLAALYIVLTVFVYFIADRHAFYPPESSYSDDENIIKLTTEDGDLISAVYLPNEDAEYTMLVSHGNAEDLGYLMPFLLELQERGFAVMAYDYHGYGTSEGRPTERHIYQDIQAAYDYLINTKKIESSHIILYGRSIGAAATIDLAAKEKVGGLILESPFVSAVRVVTKYPLFMLDRYNNLSKIKKVTEPVLIIHGKKDKIVPIWHGEKLYEEAVCPKDFLWIDDAGHNDIVRVGGEEYWKKIENVTKMEDLISTVRERVQALNEDGILFNK